MVYPLCRGCDEPQVCATSDASCKYHGLDFIRTAQTAISLRSDEAANDDWWLIGSEKIERRRLVHKINQLVLDNPDLFPPNFLIDPWFSVSE
jgi:hypothetical protein